jgi:hypothetical protein
MFILPRLSRSCVNGRISFRQGTDLFLVIPAPFFVIPAKAGIQDLQAPFGRSGYPHYGAASASFLVGPETSLT